MGTLGQGLKANRGCSGRGRETGTGKHDGRAYSLADGICSGISVLGCFVLDARPGEIWERVEWEVSGEILSSSSQVRCEWDDGIPEKFLWRFKADSCSDLLRVCPSYASSGA